MVTDVAGDVCAEPGEVGDRDEQRGADLRLGGSGVHGGSPIEQLRGRLLNGSSAVAGHPAAVDGGGVGDVCDMVHADPAGRFHRGEGPASYRHAGRAEGLKYRSPPHVLTAFLVFARQGEQRAVGTEGLVQAGRHVRAGPSVAVLHLAQVPLVAGHQLCELVQREVGFPPPAAQLGTEIVAHGASLLGDMPRCWHGATPWGSDCALVRSIYTARYALIASCDRRVDGVNGLDPGSAEWI
nr:hypothetical protein [Micromonospora sp. RL09-050-HVF-A]